MKNKKTFISLVCAAALMAGTVLGLSGFTSKDTSTASAAEAGSAEFTLLTATDEAEDKSMTVADVAEKVMPSVVTITNTSVQEVESMYGFFGMYGNDRGDTYTYEAVSVGSGIIIGENDDELLVCTNYHVVEDATELSVGFVDEEVCEASIKGTDAGIDLAVVAVSLDEIPSETMDVISIAEIGNSDDLVLGEQVVAIGNALGYGQSVTTGIVSALDRTIELDTYEAAMIQTDAAINPGNSGGPLLDMNGRVIGINSAKAAETGVEGMGYAIPISSVEEVITDLMNKKTRTEVVSEEDSAYIGITGQTVSDEVSSLYGIPEGIYVTEVEEGSPADEAGIRSGYVITKFDSSSVSSMTSLREMLAYYAAGETVSISVSYQENGEYVDEVLDLTLGSAVDYQ